jgi:hypothetical protein
VVLLVGGASGPLVSAQTVSVRFEVSTVASAQLRRATLVPLSCIASLGVLTRNLATATATATGL